MIFLLVLGYGSVRFVSLPANAAVHINGHTIQGTSVRLHPGTYSVIISSPATNPVTGTIHISTLQNVSYKPTIQLRNPDAVVSSVIGAFGTDEPVDLYHAQWLDNNTWLIGTLLPGNAAIALHYDTGQTKWIPAYFTANGYPSDLTKLPTDISAAVKRMESTYAPG